MKRSGEELKVRRLYRRSLELIVDGDSVVIMSDDNGRRLARALVQLYPDLEAEAPSSVTVVSVAGSGR